MFWVYDPFLQCEQKLLKYAVYFLNTLDGART